MRICIVGFFVVGIACGQGTSNSSFDAADVTKGFLKTFYPASILSSTADTALGFGMDRLERDSHGDDFGQRIAQELPRQELRRVITYGYRMILRDDDRRKPPTEGTRASFRRALLNIVTVEHSGNRSIALPRIASIFTMAAIDDTAWHPGLRHRTNPAATIGMAILDEAATSFYVEFVENRAERLKKKLIARFVH